MTDLEQLKSRPVLSALNAWNSAAVKGAKLDRDELTIYIDAPFIRETCLFLRDQQSFNFMSDLTCVDLHPLNPRFEVVYHLQAIARREWLRLKVRLPGDNPEIESAFAVYRSANWYERETFDLFGIRFFNHPDLRRIMMPEDWPGHPLRKDYPVTGERY